MSFPACFPVDVVFAVDTAGQILTEYKLRLNDFFVRFVTGMEVSPNCTRMSVVTFGNAVKLQFDLHAYKDARSLRHAVGELSMRNQSRDFGGAILKLHSNVFEDTDGERNNAAKLIVLITDGNSTSYPDFVVSNSVFRSAQVFKNILLKVIRHYPVVRNDVVC